MYTCEFCFLYDIISEKNIEKHGEDNNSFDLAVWVVALVRICHSEYMYHCKVIKFVCVHGIFDKPMVYKQIVTCNYNQFKLVSLFIQSTSRMRILELWKIWRLVCILLVFLRLQLKLCILDKSRMGFAQGNNCTCFQVSNL